MAENTSECLVRLLAYVSSVHVAHWLADTVTNEHKVLGDLYDGMTGMTDDFAEVYMGKYGMVQFPDDAEIEDVRNAPCSKGLELVQRLQSEFKAGPDDDLLNILADMSTLLNKSRYLLKESRNAPRAIEEKYPKVADAVRRKFNDEEENEQEEK
jgi:hypothetical protein